MKKKLDHYVPLGLNYRAELKWIAYGLVASFLYSLGFLAAYSNRYASLFWRYEPVKRLQAGAVMPDFIEILDNSLIGFVILAICMIAALVYHYAYHYQGSKSIYLMKRLPSRWELWRRLLTLPILAALFCLCTAAVLLLSYYGIYMAFTPKACLTPDQWQKIWRVILGVTL